MNNARFKEFFILVSSLFFSAHAADDNANFSLFLPNSMDWLQLNDYKSRKASPIIEFSTKEGNERSFIKTQLFAWQDQDGIIVLEDYKNPKIEEIKTKKEELRTKYYNAFDTDTKNQRMKEDATLTSRLILLERTVLKKITYNPDNLVTTNKLFPITEFSPGHKIDIKEQKDLIELQLLITSFVPINIIEEEKNNLSDYHYYIVALAAFLNWLRSINYSKNDFDNDYLLILREALEKYSKNQPNYYARSFIDIVTQEKHLQDYLQARFPVEYYQHKKSIEKIINDIIEQHIPIHIGNPPQPYIGAPNANAVNQNQQVVIVPQNQNGQPGGGPNPNINPNPQQPQRNLWRYYENIKNKVFSKKSIPVVLIVGILAGYFNKERLKRLFDFTFFKNEG